MTGWRVALRIAWRDALRHRGRSVLIVLMIGLPVLGLVAADVAGRTFQLSADQKVTREIGTADGRVDATSIAATAAQVVGRLGAGTRAIPVRDGEVVARADGGEVGAQVVETVAGDPLAAGEYLLRSGRYAVRAGEVTLDPATARQLGLRVGSSWQLVDPARTVTVVGLAIATDSALETLVLAPPGSLLAGLPAPTAGLRATSSAPSFLVTSPVPAAQWASRLGDGLSVTIRSDLLDPPASLTGNTYVQVGVVAVGLGILQVVLMAGTGFAVGARRQVRDLALVAAAGGDRRQVGAVVLAGGLIAGVVGGVAGVALGIPLARLLIPWLSHRQGVVPGPFDLRPPELAIGVGIGVLAGLMAAVLPARTAARQDVVLALAGRRGVRGTPVALTRGGAAAVVLGALVTARGAAPPADSQLVLAGTAMVELGCVAMAPALVGLTARVAHLLPLAPRMALRDAARHRVRSGPAVAAVLAAVAGLVAISTYTVSASAYSRSQYQPEVRPGQAFLTLAQEGGSALPAARAAAAALPVRAVVDQLAAYLPCDPTKQDGYIAGETPFEVCPPINARARPVGGDPGVAEVTSSAAVAFGGAPLLRALLGRDDAAAEGSLAAGHAVALDAGALSGGQVEIDADRAAGPQRVATLPAVYAGTGLRVNPSSFPSVVLPASLAASLRLHTYEVQVLLDTTRMPTTGEEARADAILRTQHQAAGLTVERGYQGRSDVIQLALAGVALVVTVGAIAIATGLAAAEGRADLATLAAVGASPGLRRRLAMAQASVIAVLGGLLGVVAGLVPAIAVVHSRAGWPLTLPWEALGLGVVVVPVVAALMAGLFTRGRLPMVARSS